MAGGGLYVLVAYGAQNVILNGNPDFTYFYLVFRKHSHFSFESVTIPLQGPQELFFNQPITLNAKIQRIGDLLSDLYLTFSLPDIYSKYFDSTVAGPLQGRSQYEFKWARYIGAHIIQDASFLIGGSLIQQFDSEYIINQSMTDQNSIQFAKWRTMVGDVPELYDPANGQYCGAAGGSFSRTTGLYPNVYADTTVNVQNNFPSIPGRDITVPLTFWFTQQPSLALPLIALQYHECSLQLTLRPIQDLYTILDPSGYRVRPEFSLKASTKQIQTGNVSYVSNTENAMYIQNYLTDIGFAVPTLNTWPLNPRLQATYVFLTEAERITFATKPLQYLVKQITRYPFPSNSSRQLFNVYTHNPVPRIFFLPRRSDSIQYRNDWMNFTNWFRNPAPFVPAGSGAYLGGSSGINSIATQQDIIRGVRILCDGNEIQELKSLDYLNYTSSWKYIGGTLSTGAAIYSFALDSSNWTKPSGTLNTSRVPNFQMDIDIWSLAQDTKYLIDHVIYVESLNFFVVEGGMGGMKYAT